MFPRVKGKKKNKFTIIKKKQKTQRSVYGFFLRDLKWGHFWFTWFECKED